MQSQIEFWGAASLVILGACLLVSNVSATTFPGDDSPPSEKSLVLIQTIEIEDIEDAPPIGQSWRVGGEPIGELNSGGSAFFRTGPCMIDTALPVDYPPPTCPGAIEIKTYPVVRRAEVTGKASPNVGTNFAFFRLFEHIQDREIAMTSPVEVDYGALDQDSKWKERTQEASPSEQDWTMSFLYRSTQQGSTGEAGRVEVVDRPVTTVISIGFQGDSRKEKVFEHLDLLTNMIEKLEGWEIAGPPRGLFYNGPSVRAKNRWCEAQIPIQRVASPEESPSPTESVRL